MKQRLSNIERDLFETICINCPGSLWGEKSICRIHNKSIGEVTTCEQWTRHQNQLSIDEGQVAFLDLDPAMEIVQKTEEDLRDYSFVVKEIERIEESLDKAIRKLGGPATKLVAVYGDEAGMPKGQGTKSTVAEERYERQFQRVQKLKEKVKRINHAAEQIVDEKERTVLECILDGERMNVVARHVGVSRQRLNEIKRLIVKKMAWVLYEDELKGM